jgi:hypothetical protein
MEKNKSEWKQKVFSRKGISLISQIAIIGLIFGIYILGDYLSFKGSMDFATSPEYWITTGISITLVVVLMTTIRNMHKDKRIAENKDIENNMQTIQAVRKVVLSNAYDEELQKHLDKVNDDKKYETFINNITKKINRLPLRFLLSKTKKEALLKKYEMLLRTPKEEVLKKNIKFKKITQTALFANVDGKLAVFSKYDIDTHEAKDVVSMVSYKSILYILLTAISGTLAVNFIFSGWSAVWGTLLKIASILMASNSAMRQANNFVDYNIEQALDNRLRIILSFVNSSEEIKSKVIEKIKDEKVQ